MKKETATALAVFLTKSALQSSTSTTMPNINVVSEDAGTKVGKFVTALARELENLEFNDNLVKAMISNSPE